MAPMRLDKYLAACGNGSRSDCKDILKAGRVTVEGEPAQGPTQKVDETAHVEVDGVIQRYRAHIYVMLNKPAGYISATYDKYKPTVVDLLEGAYGARELAPVGRLDEDTTGLLLLTDDGVLSHYLLSPKRHVPKVYVADLRRAVAEADIQAFTQGIKLEDFTTQPARLEPLEGNRARVTLTEGKYHQVKRMFLATGNEVLTLSRVSFGPLALDEGLAPGAWRELTQAEEEALRLH